MNAINDAIAPFDAYVHSQPITPQKILQALKLVD
jgi:carbon-monoxide dehydrogenase large subunit